MLKRDVPHEALDIMLASISKLTMKQYSGALRQWLDFYIRNEIEFTDTKAANVLKFLSERFQLGANYGTLNSFRSAISLISSDKIGEQMDISRFMRGAAKLRPSRPKYTVTWDVAIVLDFLVTLDCSKFENLTYETVMLLALSTAQRAQTLALIKISNIKRVNRGMEIRISEMIKTSRVGREQPLL